MPESTVQKTESEGENPDGSSRTIVQYSTGIPKQIAEFMNMEKGNKLEWQMGSARDKLELTVKNGGDDDE